MKLTMYILICLLLPIAFLYSQPYQLTQRPEDCSKYYLSSPITIPPNLSRLPWDIALSIVIMDTLCKSVDKAAIDSALQDISRDSLLRCVNAMLRISEYDPMLRKLLYRTMDAQYDSSYKIHYADLANSIKGAAVRRIGEYTPNQTNLLMTDGVFYGKVVKLDTLTTVEIWGEQGSASDTIQTICVEMLVYETIKGDALVDRYGIDSDEIVEVLHASWLVDEKTPRGLFDHDNQRPWWAGSLDLFGDAVLSIEIHTGFDSLGTYYTKNVVYVNKVTAGLVSNEDLLYGLPDGLSINQFLGELKTLQSGIKSGALR